MRREKKLTLERLDQLTGLHYTYLAKIESGSKEPSLGALNKIAKALDATPDILLKEKLSEQESAVEKLCRSFKNRKIKDIEFVVSLAKMVFSKVAKKENCLESDINKLIRTHYE
ncbi:hypothetical protein A3D23_05615 [candidate division WOR-1 bacterium RIFCSPHIGHO2_02_FULL_53_26]|nr:MAG: hypothetical protein A3D23_05615 [candidate division WOR-1 bacterium RIFCSPHIGHO2_02_FULL_53_26]